MSNDPWTPEERFARDHMLIGDVAAASCLTALRAMIEADRYEANLLLAALNTLDNRVSLLTADVARITETVNRQDAERDKLVVLLGKIRDNQEDDWYAIRQRIAALEARVGDDAARLTEIAGIVRLIGDGA